MFIESNDPGSPAHTIVDGAFSSFAETMDRSNRRRGGRVPAPVFLKALMAACQWIVHDATRKGLHETTRKEAKAAAWELVRRALYPGD